MVISVREAREKGFITPYDPHNPAGHILVEDGSVLLDFHGHPMVFSSLEEAKEAEGEKNELD